MSLTELDFQTVAKIVRDESAIALEAGKEYLVESRLAPIAKEAGFENLVALVNELRKNTNRVLTKRVVEAMTTNETSFFRDLEPFEILKKHVLPPLIKARESSRKLSLWCAACSTGQEPFSIAMMLLEHFKELASWKVEILATDINESVLSRARESRFSQLEVNRGLPAPLLIKYFSKEGMNWCLKDEVRRMVTFKALNLVKPWGPMPRFDIVLIRNVLIYFETETKKEILKNIRSVMAQDGVLFLGTAETTINIDENFERCAFNRSSCYKLKGPSR